MRPDQIDLKCGKITDFSNILLFQMANQYSTENLLINIYDVENTRKKSDREI